MNLKALFSGKKDVFGLDIGSSSVKVVQLQHQQNGYKLKAAERMDFARGSSDNQAGYESLSKIIRKCVAMAGIKSKYAVCGICGADVACRVFKFPLLREQEINSAVLFEAEQVCPFDRGRYIVDYQLIEKRAQDSHDKADNKTQGVLIAATPYLIGTKTRIVRTASLNCVLMDVDGLALLNCLVKFEKIEKGQSVSVLDIGGMFTNLAILGGKSGLPFVRDFSYGGNEILKQIADNLNIPLKVVEDEFLTTGGEKNIERFKDCLKQACQKLISDVTQTLQYHMVQEGTAVNKLYVCGGFAGVKDFVELLDKQMEPEVLLWNPLKKLAYDPDTHGTELIEKYGPSLALATGLAVRTI